MLTASALSLCLFTAAQTYAVPVNVLLGILTVEGGYPGLAMTNTNKTQDLGPMQVNTLWIPELAKHWGVSQRTALRLVRDDYCVNIGVGAWILRTKINQAGGLYKGIAWYHSATSHLGKKYRQKVLKAMGQYQHVTQPSDVVVSYKGVRPR